MNTTHVLLALGALFAWLLWTDGALTTRGATAEATKVYITIGGALALFALYWFFEKGPKKGFIQTRRTRP